MAKDTVMHEGPIGRAAKRPKTLGDGKHGGPGGVNRKAEQMHRSNFPNPGMLRPPSGDGRSAGQDGVIEKSIKVQRTVEMGKTDPRMSTK